MTTTVAEVATKPTRVRGTTKYCGKCDKRRRLDQYPPNPSREDGRGTWCTDCHQREGRRIRNAIALRRIRRAEAEAAAPRDDHDPTEVGVAWQKRAACGPGHGDLFFPVSLHETTGKAQVAVAQKVCLGCPVRRLCEADGQSARYGVWAGAAKANTS